MRNALIGLLMLLGTALTPAHAAFSLHIGVNVPVYPALVRIPNYPVYYAPSLRANYFFYDGLYWVFHDGVWYESPWYNGPWNAVDPFDVPVFLLRVPVRYYVARPAYFSGWAYDAPPRWDTYWGPTWHSERRGWNRWNRASVPAPAPLPVYQRSYAGNRYPTNPAQQAAIQTRSYSFQPRETYSRERFQERRGQARVARQQEPPRAEARVRQQERRQESIQARRQEDRAQQARAKEQRRDFQQAQQAQRREQAQVARQQRQEQRHEARQERGPQRPERVQHAERRDDRGPPQGNRGRGKDKDRG